MNPETIAGAYATIQELRKQLEQVTRERDTYRRQELALATALRYYARDSSSRDEDQGEDPEYFGPAGGYHKGQVARDALRKVGLWPPKE